MAPRNSTRQTTSDMLEKKWQADVEKHAKTFGWLCYHTYNSRRSEKGFPDLVMVRDNRVVYTELKTNDPASKPSVEQIKWLNALDEAGCEVYLWRPANLDEVMFILSRKPPKNPASAWRNVRGSI